MIITASTSAKFFVDKDVVVVGRTVVGGIVALKHNFPVRFDLAIMRFQIIDFGGFEMIPKEGSPVELFSGRRCRL